MGDPRLLQNATWLPILGRETDECLERPGKTRLAAFLEFDEGVHVADARVLHALPGILIEDDLQRGGHVRGDVVLDDEDVPHRAVVGVRPQVETVGDADELRRYAHRVALPPDTALEHVGDVEHVADEAQVFVLALEAEGGGTAGDLQVRYLRELVQEFFGEAVGEVLVLRVRTHVDEG